MIRFSYYSLPLSESNVTEIFIKALRDALMIHHRDKTPIGQGHLFYLVEMSGNEELQLKFNTGPTITWDHWWHVIGGLRLFMGLFEFVSFAFSVLDVNASPGAVFLGHGSLAVADQV